MSRIISAFTYNGEREILKIHLSILAPYVDKFIICEAKTTFSGHKKPLYFFHHQRYFKQWWPKIQYHVINEDWTQEEEQLAVESPNTKGASHWQHEFLQKEAIHKALEVNHVHDDDILMIGDVDEIMDPLAKYESHEPIKAKLRVYTYYLNNESNEQFYGTLIAKYGDIKGNCLNHMRSNTKFNTTGEPLGWHFTSQGGLSEIQRKLNDSYTTETYNTLYVQQNLEHNYTNSLDFLGRNFTFKLNEDKWPQYLKENKKEYKHMLLT